jgi:hypothetical protein
MNRIARAAGIVLFVVAGSIAIVLVRHTSSPLSQVKSHSASSSSESVVAMAITPVVPAAAEPPAAYGAPLAIAADPTTSGLWYLAGSSADVSLFHWNPDTGQLQSYSLGSPQTNTALVIGAEVGLVATATQVWVGSRDTLFDLDTSTSHISSFAVPTPTDNPYVESHRPVSIQGFHGIESIAMSPANGDIAIAMEGSESVAVYDPTSGSFASIELPDSDAPVSVAYASDGTLAVSAVAWPSGREGVVDFVSTSGGAPTISRSTMDVDFVSSDGANVLGTGALQVSQVDPSGSNGPSATALYTTSGPPAVGAIDPEVSAVSGPGSVVVAGTTSGFVVLRAGQSAQRLDLPSVACSPSVPVASTTAQVPITCQTTATAVTVDGSGNIWFVPNVGLLSEIPASSY